jgi:hypothetical protein
MDKQAKLEKAQTGEQMRSRVYAYSPDYLNNKGSDVKILN